MTFNNLDPRAWKIVLDAFARESLVCTDAKYQVPAVVSSKSQTAANTSYVGDYYCIFEKKPIKKKSTQIFDLTKIAHKVLISRNGKAPKNLIHRALVLSVLNDNFDTRLLTQFDDILKPVSTEDKDYYYLRDELKEEFAPELFIENIVIMTAESALSEGKMEIKNFYEIILEKTSDIGSPLLGEVKKILEGKVLFEKKHAYLQRKTENLF